MTMTTNKPRPVRRWLDRLVRYWRHWRLAFKANNRPMEFAEWVNSERASISIWNDPSGRWNVQIGTMVGPSSGKTLGEAMCHQFLTLELTPGWQWTSDYLSPNAPRSDTPEDAR